MFVKSARFRVTVLLLFFAVFPFNFAFGSGFNWAFLGTFFYFPADIPSDHDPVPIIPSAGVSLSWEFARSFRLEFTTDIYFTNYEYNAALGIPMASNPENRSAFVLGFVTGIQATGVFRLGSSILRVYGGPAADLRIVTLAFGLNHPADFTGEIATDPQLQTDAVLRYFWEEGRWFLPVAGFGFDFPLNQRFLLGFDFRTWFPVYRLWTNENTPTINGWRFGAGLRITPRSSR